MKEKYFLGSVIEFKEIINYNQEGYFHEENLVHRKELTITHKDIIFWNVPVQKQFPVNNQCGLSLVDVWEMDQGQKVCFSLFSCLLWVALKRLRSRKGLHSSTKRRVENGPWTGFDWGSETTGSANDDWPIQSSGPSVCQDRPLGDL